MRGRFQYDLRTLFVWFAILALVFSIGAFAYRAAGPVLRRDHLKWIEEHHATRDEVQALFGAPTKRYEGDHEWIYERWGNPGWVEIGFDENGRVNYVNDESPVF